MSTRQRTLTELQDERDALDLVIDIERHLDAKQLDARLRRLGVDVPARAFRRIPPRARAAAAVMASPLVVRSFPAKLTADRSGGNVVVSGRCVPYGVAAIVDDNNGRGPYREMFQHGAFAGACRKPRAVLLNWEHKTDIANTIGAATELVERSDGLWGTFELLDTTAGEQAAAIHSSGVAVGLSIGAVDIAHHRALDGTLVRTKCRLDHVALCREPAYAGAVTA